MNRDLLAYHEARAEEELILAERAESPRAVRAHVDLAELHMQIVYDPPASTREWSRA